MKKMLVIKSDNWSTDDLYLLRQNKVKLEIHPSWDKKLIAGKATMDESTHKKLYPHLASTTSLYLDYPVFTPKERDEAEYLILNAYYQYQDKSHSDDYSFKEKIFNKQARCSVCGWGDVQYDDFRFRTKPDLKKMRLFYSRAHNYLLFSEKTLYHEVFAPLGIGCRQVLKNMNSQPYDDIVQLIIPTILEELDMGSTRVEICPGCQRKIFSTFIREPFKKYKNPTPPPIFYANECLQACNRHIVISQQLRQTLIAHGQISKSHGIPFITEA